mgnify:CR=1 FL=1
MATNVFGAIEELFAGDSALAASCPGKLWTKFAPETVSQPYCVLTPERTQVEFTTGTSYREKQEYQLSVFGKDGASVYTAMRDIEKAFDWIALPLTGTDTHMASRRTNRVGPFPEEEDEHSPAWRGIIEYEVMVQRSL